MATLCRDIGPCPVASEGIRHAQEFLQNYCREFGALRIQTESVPLQAWEEGETKLEIV
jgi:hypothetical protein